MSTKNKTEKIIVGDSPNETKRRKRDMLNEFVNKYFNTIFIVLFSYIILTTVIIVGFFFSLQFIMYRSNMEKDRIYSDFKEYNKLLLNKDMKTTAERKEIYQRNVITIMEKYKTNLTSEEVLDLSSYIFDTYEELHWKNPYLPIALMYVESRFNKKAIGGVGEKGLVQILPSTGKMLAKSLDIEYYNDMEFEPLISMKMWFDYIKVLNDTFHGDINLVLLAYNAGPQNVINYCDIKVNKETGDLDLSTCNIENIKKKLYYNKNRKVAYDDKILNFLKYIESKVIEK